MDSLLETRSTKFNDTSTDKEETLPETRSPTRYNEILEKRESPSETGSPKTYNETSEKRGSLPESSPTRFHEASMKKRGSLPETQSPPRFGRTSTDSQSSLPESRSPTRFTPATTTEKRESPRLSDRTPPKQWESIDNSNRNRLDGDFKRPSSSSLGVVNSPKTRDQKPDAHSPSTRPERHQTLEEPLRKFETSAGVENKINSEMERGVPLNDKLVISNIPESDFKRKTVEPELPPPSSNDDSEVFWDADDSFPPPPPLQLLDPLETSQDSLPLPSPPREVLVEFPPSYAECNSRSNPLHMGPAQVSSDIIKREQVPVVESAVEIGEEPKIELNGPGKVDTSSISEQALETTASTDMSFRDTSPAENKKISHRAPPPSPLLITSTPTKDEPVEMEPPLDNSTSPYSLGSSTSTPSGSRPNSMLSPKLEALDKEKVS